MLLKEAQLRSMIRSALLSEITNWGINGVDSMKEKDCPFYTEIPTKFAKLFQADSSKDFAALISREFPKLAAGLGILGMAKNSSSLASNKYNPNDVTELITSNNGAEILFGYLNSYLYIAGVGCLQYFYLGKALDIIGSIMGVSYNTATASSDSSPVHWHKALVEKASSMATDSTGFTNDYAFYVFPRLASNGPDIGTINNLKNDIKLYQKKFDVIKNIKGDNIKKCFNKISDALDIKSTIEYKQISKSIGTGDENEVVVNLKKNAIAALFEMFNDASLNYKETINTNIEFRNVLESFVRRNS